MTFREYQSEPAHIRYAQRLLHMVHDLHKLGYQKLRILPYMAPSGCYWRCEIRPARDFSSSDGGKLTVHGEPIARYSSADADRFFGWQDAGDDDPLDLALKFTDCFPVVNEVGLGSDWSYAGWYVELLSNVDCAYIPYFFADDGLEVRHVRFSHEDHEAAQDARMPLPPPGEGPPE